MNLSRLEKKTADLYSGCFRRLEREQWSAQGALLAEQLGLSPANVGGKIILDAGCGHGALVWQLVQKGAQEVYGLDLKPTPPSGIFESIARAHLVEGSLMKLPFADGRFDLVVSSGVLHHTVDPEKGFFEMTRVLKPGGELILGVYGKHGLFPYALWFMRLFTVKLPLVRQSFVRKLVDWLGLNPIWRYQVLDYLFVPILKRYSPREVEEFFLRHGFKNLYRVSSITPEKAAYYRSRYTSYSYDHRQFWSKILFGYGFIVMSGEKAKSVGEERRQ